MVLMRWHGSLRCIIFRQGSVWILPLYNTRMADQQSTFCSHRPSCCRVTVREVSDRLLLRQGQHGAVGRLWQGRWWDVGGAAQDFKALGRTKTHSYLTVWTGWAVFCHLSLNWCWDKPVVGFPEWCWGHRWPRLGGGRRRKVPGASPEWLPRPVPQVLSPGSEVPSSPLKTER